MRKGLMNCLKLCMIINSMSEKKKGHNIQEENKHDEFIDRSC